MMKWVQCLEGGQYHLFRKELRRKLWMPVCGLLRYLSKKDIEDAEELPRLADRCWRCERWRRRRCG